MKKVSEKEREYLRELAKKQLEYANLPVMHEREALCTGLLSYWN